LDASLAVFLFDKRKHTHKAKHYNPKHLFTMTTTFFFLSLSLFSGFTAQTYTYLHYTYGRLSVERELSWFYFGLGLLFWHCWTVLDVTSHWLGGKDGVLPILCVKSEFFFVRREGNLAHQRPPQPSIHHISHNKTSILIYFLMGIIIAALFLFSF